MAAETENSQKDLAKFLCISVSLAVRITRTYASLEEKLLGQLCYVRQTIHGRCVSRDYENVCRLVPVDRAAPAYAAPRPGAAPAHRTPTHGTPAYVRAPTHIGTPAYVRAPAHVGGRAIPVDRSAGAGGVYIG